MADVGEIRARLVLSSDQFNRGMRDARGQMDATNRSAERTSKAIDKIHQASAVFATAVGAVFVASIGTAANFEQKMKDVQAVSGESADNMQKLTDLAMEMGKKTAFSSAEAAQGIEELIKAGVSVTAILNGGLEGALNLAIAGNLGLGEAAEIASTALNSFKNENLSVAQAADILAGAANASATDVREMKMGLSMVSAVASGVGLTFQDTSTALALFAQNGLKSSDAGTSLKTMLLNLSPSTKEASEQMKSLGLLTAKGTSIFYDSHGSLKSMSEIAEILKTKLANLSDEQRQMALKTMFGTDAIRAANVLYKEGAKGINDMWGAMSKVKAADVAKVKLDSLKGAFTELTSALESVGIKIGMSFLPALTQITRKANEFVGSLEDVNITNIESALAFAGTAAAVAFLGTSIVKLASSFRLVFAAMGPAGWIVLGLSLIGGAIAASIVKQNELNEVTLDHVIARKKEADALDASIKQYEDLKYKSKLTNDEFARFVDIGTELSKTADVDKIQRLTEEQDKLRQKSGLSNDELNKMVGLNDDLIKKVPEATKKITDQGNAILESTSKLKQYSAAQLDKAYKELDLEKIKNETKYRDLLKEEEGLITKRHTAEDKLQTLINERNLAQNKANEEERKLNAMMSDTEKHSQAALDSQVQKMAAAKTAAELLQKQVEAEATLVQETGTDLEKTREKIKKLEEVRNQMAQIQLAQVGLTSKVGEELSTIGNAIGKLKEQKKTLEETTPAAKRNSAEYREAVSAIDQQIGKLESAKDKVEEITGKAIAMNAELGKDITKTITERVIQSGTGYKSKAMQYHTGGIVGRGQMPKLHVGGAAAQFANAPMHNEVDVRLLKDEWVLTQAQQANLFRMIDAGFTNKPSAQDNGQVIALLQSMDSKMTRGFNSTIVMDDREVGRIVEPHVTEVQSFKQDRKGRF